MIKPWWMPEDVEPQQVIDMYVEQGMSIGSICRAIGLDATARQSSVNYFLRQSGVQIRSLPTKCTACGCQIVARGTGQKFCNTCVPGHKWLQVYHKYGITKPQYDALYEKQSGLCALCELPLDSGRYIEPHIDHCHKQGHVRGLLHKKCNVGLHYIEDDKFLANAVRYIELHRK